MKIITVLIGDPYGYPPVLNLLHAFEYLKIKNTLITTKSRKDLREDFKYTTIKQLNIDYEGIKSPINKMISLFKWRSNIWNLINSYYEEDTIIWVITDVSLKILGDKITGKNFVLHLLELSEDIRYYYKLSFLKMNTNKIGNSAKMIVVPEYNRAHITKALWGLNELPFILPNKPFNNVRISKNSNISDYNAKKVIEKIGNKKIILYQGIISPERPLNAFIDAVDKFNGKYAFVIMSGGKNIYGNHNSDNYYFIPFVTPPLHLEITSHAHIGVLSYTPTENTGYSKLNTLYCAPNKTFEYSKFGIPMLGNNIPGLKFLFETKNCGICFDKFTEDCISQAIKTLEDNFKDYSINSLNYYNNCNYTEILKELFKILERQILNEKNTNSFAL